MKKIVLAALIFTSYSSAFAGNYDCVKALFDTGMKPTDEILGLNIGRCYFKSNPSRGYPFVLYFRSDDTDKGPIRRVMGTSYSNTDVDEDFYDGRSLNYLLSTASAYPATPIDESDNALLVASGLFNFPFPMIEVRMNGDYFVARLKNHFYCYTFINKH